MAYYVETLRDGRWTQEGLGEERRVAHATETEARAAIGSMRECGDDWRAATYRVVERGAQYPAGRPVGEVAAPAGPE